MLTLGTLVLCMMIEDKKDVRPGVVVGNVRYGLLISFKPNPEKVNAIYYPSAIFNTHCSITERK